MRDMLIDLARHFPSRLPNTLDDGLTGYVMDTPLPLGEYAALLLRWLRGSDAIECERVLVAVDEMARQLLSRRVTQDELISMHHEAQGLVVRQLQADGWPVASAGSDMACLRTLATGEAMTPLLALLVPMQLETARNIKRTEEALHFNDMMRLTALAAGVSHDFNNLLGAIIGLAELGLQDVPAESVMSRRLQGIVHAAKQGSAVVRGLHEFDRSQPLQRRDLDLATWLKGCRAMLAASLPAHVTLCDRVEANSRVNGDPTKLEQVLINLVKNAGHAMGRKVGHVSVILDQADQPGGGKWARLRVVDQGTGIANELMPHIFAPYFTTKPAGEGAGMGLSAAHGIVRQHEGTIEVSGTPGAQTVFTVLLPLA